MPKHCRMLRVWSGFSCQPQMLKHSKDLQATMLWAILEVLPHHHHLCQVTFIFLFFCSSVLGGINVETLNFSPRQRDVRESISLQGQSNAPAQTNANTVGAQTVIDVSSDSSDISDNSRYFSDSSSVSGDEGVYYGGYGRCFNCGECLRLHPRIKIIFCHSVF